MDDQEIIDLVAVDLESRANLFLRKQYPELDGVRVTDEASEDGEHSFTIELRNKDELDPEVTKFVMGELTAWLEDDYDFLNHPTVWESIKSKVRDLFS